MENQKHWDWSDVFWGAIMSISSCFMLKQYMDLESGQIESIRTLSVFQILYDLGGKWLVFLPFFLGGLYLK